MEKYFGTLSDIQINNLCVKNKLIIENYDRANLKQACYELRAGNIYYDLSSGPTRYDLLKNKYDYILLKPKQTVVIITREKLDLPLDILGRILTKGKLFSIGILPVNTYADPGFFGYLGLVLYNTSNDYLKIYPGDRIAKIEFSKLNEVVSTPYTGQHGYETKIWPIPTEMKLDDKEKINDARINDPHIEIENSFGKEMASVIKKVFSYERKLIFYSGFYFLLNLLILLFITISSPQSVYVTIVSYTVALGIIANLFTQLVILFATNIKKDKLWKFWKS